MPPFWISFLLIQVSAELMYVYFLFLLSVITHSMFVLIEPSVIICGFLIDKFASSMKFAS